MARQTPSQITCKIIQAALSSSGMSVAELARRVQVHVNTVRNDLHDPDRIPQNRLWLYFTVLGVPIEDALEKIAKESAEKIAERATREAAQTSAVKGAKAATSVVTKGTAVLLNEE